MAGFTLSFSLDLRFQDRWCNKGEGLVSSRKICNKNYFSYGIQQTEEITVPKSEQEQKTGFKSHLSYKEVDYPYCIGRTNVHMHADTQAHTHTLITELPVQRELLPEWQISQPPEVCRSQAESICHDSPSRLDTRDIMELVGTELTEPPWPCSEGPRLCPSRRGGFQPVEF